MIMPHTMSRGGAKQLFTQHAAHTSCSSPLCVYLTAYVIDSHGQTPQSGRQQQMGSFVKDVGRTANPQCFFICIGKD